MRVALRCSFLIFSAKVQVTHLGNTITHTEKELVSLLKNRDNRAFAYLYDHYSGALYSIILQVLNNNELAADVLQEAFVNIWRKIELYDESRGRLFTWMLNIARNASIDMLRSKQYQNSQKNRPIPENVDTMSGSMELNIDNLGLRKLLQNLKQEHRMLIDLAYFKGYTHEEIAALENIPLGTVKTRIRNALIQLRALIK